MSVHVWSLVLSKRLGGVERKAVALKLADHAHDDGSNIFPSLENIAAHAEVSKSTVQRIIGHFLEIGLLHVVSPGGRGRKSSTLYRMDLTFLAGMEPCLGDQAVTIKEQRLRYSGRQAKVVSPARLGVQAVTTEPSVNRQITVNDSRGMAFSGGTDASGNRFYPAVIAELAALDVDVRALVDRYNARTRGKRIRDPNAYLLQMGRDEVAKRHGVPAEQIKQMCSKDRNTRRQAAAEAAGAFNAPSPQALATAKRRGRKWIPECIGQLAKETFRTQAACDAEFNRILDNARFRTPTPSAR